MYARQVARIGLDEATCDRFGINAMDEEKEEGEASEDDRDEVIMGGGDVSEVEEGQLSEDDAEEVMKNGTAGPSDTTRNGGTGIDILDRITKAAIKGGMRSRVKERVRSLKSLQKEWIGLLGEDDEMELDDWENDEIFLGSLPEWVRKVRYFLSLSAKKRVNAFHKKTEHTWREHIDIKRRFWMHMRRQARLGFKQWLKAFTDSKGWNQLLRNSLVSELPTVTLEFLVLLAGHEGKTCTCSLFLPSHIV